MSAALKFKPQVRFTVENLEECAVAILRAVASTAPDNLYGNTVFVTSANDSVHKDGSLHYSGRAFDLRTEPLPSGAARVGAVMAFGSEAREKEIRWWCQRIRAQLGDDYDVVQEIDHIHVEYDPKGSGGRQ